jgi:hypothetical protein
MTTRAVCVPDVSLFHPPSWVFRDPSANKMPRKPHTRRTQTSLTWSLTDFRAWWGSLARIRWLRALGLIPARDLTNFGDLR